MPQQDAPAAKRRLLQGLRALARAAPDALGATLSQVMAPGLRWRGSHPLGEMHGIDAVEHGVWQPLKAAFPDLERRDDILLGGEDGDGGDWIAATGHYFGSFGAPFLGIPPTGGFAHLRFGEFYRLEGGLVVDAFVLLDLLDLMRQAGVSPWRPGLGVETLSPGPASHDGLRLGNADGAETTATLALMHAMLGSLFEPDRAAAGMERFWSPTMMWYGPCGIGTTRGLDGFFRGHEDPWVAAMPDWRVDPAGRHVEIGEDAYAALVGWPSLAATHTGPLLGLPPTGRAISVNLMDFYRREGSLLAENWIFIDLPHLFLQLGVDLFARMAERCDRAR